MKKYLIHIVLFLCFTQQFHAQEDGVVSFAIPVRNSLKFNRHIINPTFSFVREQNKYISFNNRRQWVQFDDAPQTYLFGYSGRFREDIGVGVSLFQQNYGVLTTFGGLLNFAYNVVLNRDSNLTFGLNLGFYRSGLNEGKVVTNFPDSSLDNIPSNSLLTINPGINYGTDFLDFGIAINNAVLYNLNASKMVEDDPEQSVQAHVMYTGYANTRGFFDESKFSGLIKSEFKKDNTVISGIAMLTVPKGIWAQAGYNTLYGLFGGIGFNISTQISIEYNYEKAMGDLVDFGSSHDITLAYKFKNRYRYRYSGDEEEGSVIIPDKKSRRYIAKRRAPSKPKVSAQDRAAARAKAKADAEARVAAAEARAKERAEAAERAKAEAEAKAGEEARLKREAEAAAAKAKADEEARLKREAEAAAAKAKADEEARLKREAEAAAAKAKADEEARLKREAEAAAAKAKADEEARLKREAEAAAAKAKADEAARLKREAEAAVAKAKADEEARLKREAEAAVAKAKADEEARLKREAEAAAAKAKADEEARLKREAEAAAAKDKADEEARLKREAEAAAAKAKADEEARLKREAEAAAAKAKADEEARLKREAEAAAAKAKADEEARLKREAEAAAAKAKADEEARLKREAEAAAAKAKADEEARLKREAEAAAAKAKADEEARLKREAEAAAAKAKADEEARLKREAEAAAAKAKADEEARLKREAEAAAAKAKADEEARLKQEAEAAAAKAKAEEEAKAAAPTPVDDITKSMNDLLTKLDETVASRDKDLKDLKEENDLGEKGIFTAPKPFKSITAENAALESLKSELDGVINTRNEKITELEKSYRGSINPADLKMLERLKLEQAQALKSRENLMGTLEKIKVATEIERKRRIKRAAYDNADDRYSKDMATLNRIKQNTPVSSVPLKEEDFDFGEKQSGNIRIVKDVKNVESGYYLVIAVHDNVDKRDEFVKKTVSAGQSNVNFFYDENTSKYFIYYEQYSSVEQATRALQSKGDKPYNGEMSMVKIEN
ncbi:type IX secretion system membrane protein PorP/SprF [Flavivirga abyssicola]|uniref:PorP/SprF family type IX secretion system membrane protein n=1 Tax=Flavivirga abyssicola TaxID=3063533 RepID=UPI0026DEDA1B|nr:type IX secretion system membrane protein PorP/SprF [Flavivirga sp. MEBiC07777]WVK12759.1 type IX secretion system membrane protein PorP/SprF [Flavivirga sp. MEBiC07777]